MFDLEIALVLSALNNLLTLHRYDVTRCFTVFGSAGQKTGALALFRQSCWPRKLRAVLHCTDEFGDIKRSIDSPPGKSDGI